MRIAYAGAPGAFAHEACLAFSPDKEPFAVESFAAVAAAVESGAAACGMLPVRNSRAGTVKEVASLLAAGRLRIAGAFDLPVRLHLLALPGTALGSIRAVISHPMALRQCAASVAAAGWDTIAARNTAVAARDLADPERAVLASEAAALAYGLAILRRDVHDDPDNKTHFARVVRG